MGDLIGSIIAAPFICIGWIVVGIIAGALARQLTGSRDANFLSDMILGLIGAFVGGLLASLLGFYKPEGGLELVLVNLVISTIGAAILIVVGRALTGGRAMRT
jgi:uncharacterized membrane protein YeaQ/YmgE (transglycosylase-associated protein family)